jgi:transcriptional regulator with XRE-family HTH domain
MKEHEGARLERWLIEQGISKSQLAEKLGIYLSGISYVLSREKIPVKHRAKLKALGFDIEAEHQNPNSDGYKLKQFIDSNNLKVKDVAEKLGKAPQYITNLYTSQRFSSSLLELLHKIGFDLKAYPQSTCPKPYGIQCRVWAISHPAC